MVVKAEEHGSVRCRVFNGSNGSFPFVLSRHTVQWSFLYQRRYFRFFPELFLYRSCPFFQEGHGDAEDRIILGYVSKLLGLLLYVLGCIPSRLGPWAPMQKWARVTNYWAPQHILGKHDNLYELIEVGAIEFE